MRLDNFEKENIMRKCITIMMIFFIAGSVFAYDKDERSHRKKRGFFRGGAGGFDTYMLPLEIKAINSQLGDLQITEFKDNMFLTGGGGWGYVGKSIRIGGLGFGGFTVTDGAPVSGKIQKEFTLSLGFGGFLIERSFHPFNNSEIYIGSMIGGGTAAIKMVQWSGPVTWDDVWSGYSTASDPDTTTHAFYDYQTDMSSHFFTVMPSIGFTYNVFRWCAIGLSAGYLYTNLDQEGWKMEGRRVSNAPEIDFSNTIYRLSVYFGG